MKDIKVIGFDADDTLWECSIYFKEVESVFCSLLSDYLSPDELVQVLFRTEEKNMPLYGYGVMAYTLSLIETAIEVSHEKVPVSVLKTILESGRQLLQKPVTLCPGAVEVIPLLNKVYQLVLVTKGDLLDQERKLKSSGLTSYFHHIEIVSEKHSQHYARLLQAFNIQPSEFLMVGDSLKSDILPVVKLGANAVHIPHPSTWKYEQASDQGLLYRRIDSLLELPSILFTAFPDF